MIQVNKEDVAYFKFPNGELGFKPETLHRLDGFDHFHARIYYEGQDDLLALAMLRSRYKEKDGLLTLPYMPYSRQDRPDIGLFMLRFVADMINDMRFRQVTVLEPHSDVSVALLNNVVVFPLVPQMFEDMATYGDWREATDYVFFPDAGAYKRYGKPLNLDKDSVLFGAKTRDVSGSINSLEIFGKDDLNQANVLIVDDLCSRGGTFLEAAKKLKERNAGDIRLLVAHCEPTVFSGDLVKSGLVKKIYTTNSILKEVPSEYKGLFSVTVL